MAYCGFMPFRGPHAAPPCQAFVPRRLGRRPTAVDADGSVAVFDEATPERSDVLRHLLQGSAVRLPGPALGAGWNLRLVLEEPDPIHLAERSIIGFGTTGLFDAGRGSLALVEGRTLVGFGGLSCLDRLEASLTRAVPFDLADLRIAAVPHGAGADHGADLVLSRPSFDLNLRGISP